MSFDAKKALRRLSFKPLRIITTPYRRLSDRRKLANEIQEEQRKIAEENSAELVHFHEELWSHWPNTVQHIRQDVSKEENNHE
jgi:hypothetical protein